MRIIVVFEKGVAVRFIAHLDLMRTMQRALRRSGLPLQFSRGFNPHINLSFAYPLSVGVAGHREIMDVPLEGEVSEAEFVQRLNAVLPSCLQVQQARLVPDEFPTLMALVAGSKMTIDVDGREVGEKIAEALKAFMASDECIELRKTKSGENLCNIRPFVTEASSEPTADGLAIHCVIENNAGGALKPSVLMTALSKLAGLEDVFFIAYRDAILAKNKQGKLIPLEEYDHA